MSAKTMLSFLPGRRAGLVAILLLLAACTSVQERRHELLQRLAGLERRPAPDPRALADDPILKLGPAATAFVENKVAGIREPYEKVRALRRAVFDPDGLDYDIDDDLTLTADESFRRASGNCVALANFFVAAVRHLGMDAGFQEVQRGVTREEDDLRVLARHINVSGEFDWRNRRVRYVLDYLSVPEQDLWHATHISDRRAFAHYYNNLAIRHLQNEDPDTAVQYLKKALLEDSGVDFVWSNLGVVYARRGDFEAADYAYRRALALNGDNAPARRNLQRLQEKRRGGARPEAD